jgi:hypothetical protein
MPRITIPVADLGDREKRIRQLLREIVGNMKTLQVRGQKDASGGHIISASDAFSADVSPRDRLFRTTSPRLFGQYMELWVPDRDSRVYHLKLSYLHLVATPTRNDRDELFCLHSDPEEPLEEHGGRVKASLHFHVETKEDRLLPLAKSHLPLCYGTVESVLASAESFDKALLEAVRIVRTEVVDRFR